MTVEQAVKQKIKAEWDFLQQAIEDEVEWQVLLCAYVDYFVACRELDLGAFSVSAVQYGTNIPTDYPTNLDAQQMFEVNDEGFYVTQDVDWKQIGDRS